MKSQPLLMVKAFLFFLLANAEVNSQPAYFVKEFGDSTLNNHGNSALQISSGSIFFAGYAITGAGGTNRDFTITKLDASGNTLWTNHYGTIQDETSARMIYDGNKSLIVCGQLYDTSLYTTTAMLLSVDTSGNLQWIQYYSTPHTSQSFSGLCLASDGGLLASGFQSDSTSSGNNFFLIKTDAQGNLQWNTTYGDPDNNEVSDAVMQLANGDILVSGDRQVDATKYNAWLIKTDASGNMLWNLVSTNRNNGGCKNILVDNNNDILVIGEAATDSSSQFDIQLTKCDQNGNLLWLKYVPATNESDAGFAIQQASSKYYMITGYYFDTVSSAKKIIMMLLDTAGNEISKKFYGDGMQNIGYDLQPSVYGGYLIAGTDFSNSHYVLVYDNIPPPTGIATPGLAGLAISCFPNPFSNTIIVSGTHNGGTIEIFDVAGELVFTKKPDQSETRVGLENLNSGFYLLRYAEDYKAVNIKLLKF